VSLLSCIPVDAIPSSHAVDEWHCFTFPLSAHPCRVKVAQLQRLFFVDDHSVPKHIGNMAALFGCDICGTIQPRLAFLQALTGGAQPSKLAAGEANLPLTGRAPCCDLTMCLSATHRCAKQQAGVTDAALS